MTTAAANAVAVEPLKDGRARLRTATAACSAAVVLSALVWVVLRWLQGPGVFPYDDSYITLHAAQALHLGHDPNFPGVSPLFGSTSAPFLALVSALIFALPPLAALSLAGWLGIAAYVLGLVSLCRGLRLRLAESAGVVFLGLAAGTVPMQLLNGLETSWTLAAILWTLALANARRHSAAAVAAGIAAAIRPEMALFAVCIVVALCVRERRGWRRSVWLVLLGALPVVPGCLWYLHATGHPFPMTGIAKRYFFAEDQNSLPERLEVLAGHFFRFSLSCGVVAVAPLLLLRSAIARASVIFVGVFFALALSLPGSVVWNFYRYMTPLVGVVVWACATQLGRATARGRWFARVFLVASVVWAAVLLPGKLRTYRHDVAQKHTNLLQQAEWCRDHLPADSVVLVHDVGYLSYATKLHLVDMVGLKTPEAIEINREITWPSAGDDRAQAIATLAREQHATHIVLLQGWLDMDQVPEQLRALGWAVEPLSTARAYHIFRITPPAH